ncbi:prolyl oligopeptidase family serine peptidase [Roseimicrobium sp. ORNL1]|uniref:prolyl oligopeptidase family serine peptidase n=1 Tax=Roseimicrobium sp. ORNL1 TaxID=2711231 RepID=UPI0013E17067|nr:prolyl oligopeptidase family serine peptidase [Roseimicrobium sp. ORNL1]QIF05272.1 prolyl oligopeptidase family serine peptidase [Roseimicrobium sp. ORNL1]
MNRFVSRLRSSVLTLLAFVSANAFDFAHAQSGPPRAQTPAGVKEHRDLAYVDGGHERHKLDLFLPEKAESPLPLIIWVHGGGWQNGSKDGCPPLRQGYVEKGYAVASINYRLSSHATFPAQIEDCKAAVRWLRTHAKEYGLDPERFGVWGSSAGGHLVALLGTSGDVKEFDVGANINVSSRVQAVCDFYGPTDFVKFASTPGYESHAQATSPEAKLLGGAPLENKDKAAQANSITYVTKDDPPFLIVHGDSDRTVPLNQSEALHAALKQAGVSTHFHVIHGAGHGGPGFAGENIDAMVSTFFEQNLKGKSAEVVALQTESNAPAGTPSTPQRPGPPQPTGAPARRGIPWEAITRRDDKNGDGKVTKDEFSGPAQLFSRLDKNGDGTLTKEEHEGAMPPAAPTPAPTATPSTPPSSASSQTPPSSTSNTNTSSSAAAASIKNFKLDGERWTCEADGKPLSGILIKPAGKGPFPAILINHGLGSNAEQFGRMKAKEFVQWGMVCIATDLTHARPQPGADRSQFGASTENLRRAKACLAILGTLPEVDAKRICVYGNSMGAFLTVGLAAEVPGQIAAAAISAGGVITQTGFPSPTVDAAKNIRTPFIILHGDQDTTVPPENSARLKEVLDQQKVPNERHVFPRVSHNLHAEKADEVYRLIRAWFAKQGVLKP